MKRLVIDTETTGLSPYFNKTLTVGLLLIDVEKRHLKILDENHIFIKHNNYNATSAALKVNGINLKEHDKIASPPKIACKKINTFVENNDAHEIPLLGHNLHFDKGFISALFDQGETFSKFHHQFEDTMYIWRSLQKAGKIPYGLRGNLGTVANYFGIDYTKAHDALADCKITAKVYRNMLTVM